MPQFLFRTKLEPKKNAMKKRAKLSLLCTFVCFQQQALAHSTVSELAELSLEDLLAIEVGNKQLGEGAKIQDTRWSANFGVYSHRLGGYRHGSSSLSNAEVMVMPNQPRTNLQYPVLATEIRQTVFTASLSYRPDSQNVFSVTLPYVRQNTNHKSTIENYDRFSIDTEGIGDIGLSWRNIFYRDEICHFSGGIGLSIPTGSIDEEGDTPRAAGDQQLPYTMQLGSGTFDAKFSFGMSWYFTQWTWVTDLSYVQRLNENDRNYRLGNRFNLATSLHRALSEDVSLQINVGYQTSGSITGSDQDLEVGGPFPYPASITDPANFGGDIARLGVGLKVDMSDRHSLVIGLDEPVYQYVNGVQPEAKARVHLNWIVDF